MFLGIRAKLLVGFIGVALFAAALGTYALWTMARLNEGERAMYVDLFGGTHILATYIDESWGARSDVLDFLLSEEDATPTTSLRQRSAATDARLADLARQMDEADIDRADVATLAGIEKAWQAYSGWRDQALDLVEAGRRPEALASYRTDGQPLGAAVDVAIDEFLAHKLEVAGPIYTSAEAAYDSARQVALLLAVGAVALALVIGIVASATIAGAARQAAVAASGLAVGDLNQRIGTTSRDELGQMASAFRSMIVYQQEMAGVANAIAQGDLQQEVHPKGDSDVLGTAFERMAANLRSLVGELERAVQRANELAQVAEEREARVRAVLNSVGDGIVTVDEHGVIESLNPAAERLFGYPASEVVGASVDQLLPGAKPVPSQERETIGRRRDGQLFAVDFSANVLELSGQSLLILSVRDASARKEAEQRAEQMAQSDKLRALGQMASGIAHNLNQSLALVAGYGEMVRVSLERDTDAPLAQEYLKTIIQAALDGGETVKRLLTFSHHHTEVPAERVDVAAVLRQIAQLTAPQWRDAAQAEGRRIDLQLDIETQTPLIVDGWPPALREALTNLVLNAVDALPSGGEIRLSARARDGRVIIEVSDTGTGMPPGVQARVFEPFFTTKGESGTGLGLAQTYGTVQQHQGEISVQSEVGRGTTFRLSFPRAAAETPAAPTHAAISQGPTRRLHILAIDDEPALARMVRLILSRQGHDVETVTSGEAGLARLAEETFDVVVTDLGLGDGPNGWQVAEQVRSRWPETRVVLATGWGAGIDPDAARERGVEAVLAKPYAAEELRRLVDQLAEQIGRERGRAA